LIADADSESASDDLEPVAINADWIVFILRNPIPSPFVTRVADALTADAVK
jgi:hypothetical protein